MIDTPEATAINVVGKGLVVGVAVGGTTGSVLTSQKSSAPAPKEV